MILQPRNRSQIMKDSKPEGSSMSFLLEMLMNFFKEVMRCFWKLWQEDLCFLEGGYFKISPFPEISLSFEGWI
jgi:hypothetical protein